MDFNKNSWESARKLFDARDDISGLFEKGIFLYKDNQKKKTKLKQKDLQQKKKNQNVVKKFRKNKRWL